MKTTDVLLSPAMASARAAALKTVTRRIVKLPEGATHQDVSLTRMQEGYPDGVRPIFGDENEPNLCSVKNPYGSPGDRIRWLTTWAVSEPWDCLKPSDLPDLEGGEDRVFWSYHGGATKPEGFGKLRPGRFLPLSLRPRMPVDEIVSVRVERLHEITEEDAVKEGVIEPLNWAAGDHIPDVAKKLFRTLWGSINGPGSWDLNPFVWVIEFRRIG